MMEVRFADAQTWAIYVTQKRSAVRMGWVFLDWFFVQTGDGTTVIVGVSASAEVAGQAWHCSQRVGETMCAFEGERRALENEAKELVRRITDLLNRADLEVIPAAFQGRGK